jgi:cell division protein FtsQ
MTSRYTTHLRPRPEVNTSVALPLDVRLMHMAASLMFVTVIVGVLCAGLWALVRLPVFALTGITVLGEVEHNNAVTLRANVTSKMTGNFFTADLDRVRSAFESVPWVRLATVQREFPNRLRVTLQEHKPVAFWGDDSESRFVNSYGEVFEANVGDLDDEKLPRLNGPDSQSEQVLTMYLALTPLFQNMTLAIQSLELTGRGSWRAHVGRGAVIELGRGNTQEVMARMQVMNQTLAQVTQKLGRKVSAIESADLRHENGYALRLRGVSTQDVLAPRARTGQ